MQVNKWERETGESESVRSDVRRTHPAGAGFGDGRRDHQMRNMGSI